MLTPEQQEIFASLKTLEQDHGLTKKDFPAVWSPFTMHGKDNPKYGRGVPTEEFMRTEEFKKRMSATIKEQFANGRVGSMTGKKQTKYNKEQSSKANADTFTLTFKDGSKKTITNLHKFCIANNYNAQSLRNGMRLRGYYKDIIGLIKNPK